MDIGLKMSGNFDHPFFGKFHCVFNCFLDDSGRSHTGTVGLKQEMGNRRSSARKEIIKKTNLLHGFNDSLKTSTLHRDKRKEKMYREYCVSLDKDIQILDKDVQLYSYCYWMCIEWLKESNKRLDTLQGMSEAIRNAKWKDLKQGSLFNQNLPNINHDPKTNRLEIEGSVYSFH